MNTEAIVQQNRLNRPQVSEPHLRIDAAFGGLAQARTCLQHLDR